MQKLDALDRKILAALDQDARASESEIGKAVGTSKQVVGYRLHRLEERGIITGYYTILNAGKLGLDSYYIYMQLSGLNKEEEQHLLKELQALPHVGWLVTGVGRWDLVLLVYAESVTSFDTVLSDVQQRCKDHLHECAFTTLLGAEHLSYFAKPQRTVKQTQRIEPYALDAVEKKLLATLDQHGRTPVTQLAVQAKIPLHTAHYHLRQMTKSKVIEGFKPKIDIGKLGYQWHLLLIQFSNVPVQRKEQFIRYCKEQPAVYYLTSTVGQYNLMLDIHVEDPQQFREVLFSFKDRFADVIKLYESMVIFEELKISYVPKNIV